MTALRPFLASCLELELFSTIFDLSSTGLGEQTSEALSACVLAQVGRWSIKFWGEHLRDSSFVLDESFLILSSLQSLI